MDTAEFDEKLYTLYQESERFLKGYYDQRPLHGKVVETYGLNERGYFRKHEMVVDYFISLMPIIDQLETTTPYREFEELLRQEERIDEAITNMIGDGLSFTRLFPWQLITNILVQLYIAGEASIESAIATVRNQVLEFFRNDNFDRKYVIYLENIDFDSDKIVLEDHVTISSLSQHDKLQLLNTVPAFASIYGFFGPSWQRTVLQEKMTSIESRYTVRKYIKHDDEDCPKPPQPDHETKAPGNIFRLLNSIRILSDEIVIHSPLFHFNYSTPFRPQVGSGLYEYTNRLTSRFCFDRQKIDTLRKLYSSIEKIENRHLSVRIGLGRLGKIGIRDSLEDKVLDLFIGFEAIVLGGIGGIDPIQSELRFRLAALTAKYLGKDTSEQKRLYRQLRDGYDLRSAIAHGSRNLEIKSDEVEELRKVYHRLLYKWINDLEHGNRPDTPTLLFG